MSEHNPDLEDLPINKLQALVKETEETLADLKAELEERKHEAQHMAIEHLDDHMENAHLSLNSIKDFFSYLVNHFRGDKS